MAIAITTQPHKIAWIDYLGKTGATDRKALLDFIVGCYDLGIWSNMVCWPLRSTQNAGSGTVVHSLGGLGTFNGTISGTVGWGANGLEFSAGQTPGHVVTIAQNIFGDTNDRFLFACGRCNVNILGNGALVGWEGSPGIAIFPFENKTALFSMGLVIDPFGAVAVSQRVFLGFSHSGNTMTGFRDAATTASATGAILAATQAMQFGRYGFQTAELTGDISIVIAGKAGKNTTFDLAKYQSLYAIYKNTIGQGLGLP